MLCRRLRKVVLPRVNRAVTGGKLLLTLGRLPAHVEGLFPQKIHGHDCTVDRVPCAGHRDFRRSMILRCASRAAAKKKTFYVGGVEVHGMGDPPSPSAYHPHYMRPHSVRTFIRTLTRTESTESRLLIRSACPLCGASKLVSSHDDSLERWEEEHVCGASGDNDAAAVDRHLMP